MSRSNREGAKRVRTVRAMILATSVVVFAAAGPAWAGPPIDVLDTTFIPGIYDPVDGLAIYWNTTRDDVCTWLAGGGQGPQPALVPIKWFVNPTPAGPLKITWGGTSRLELWAVASGSNLQAGDFVPCDSTSGGTAWAIGSADIHATDDDFFVSGTRTDSFGYRGIGSARDATDTAWRDEFHFRATIDRQGAFRLVGPWQFVLSRTSS